MFRVGYGRGVPGTSPDGGGPGVPALGRTHRVGGGGAERRARRRSVRIRVIRTDTESPLRVPAGVGAADRQGQYTPSRTPGVSCSTTLSASGARPIRYSLAGPSGSARPKEMPNNSFMSGLTPKDSRTTSA